MSKVFVTPNDIYSENYSDEEDKEREKIRIKAYMRHFNCSLEDELKIIIDKTISENLNKII
jgi:hypothetical protein